MCVSCISTSSLLQRYFWVKFWIGTNQGTRRRSEPASKLCTSRATEDPGNGMPQLTPFKPAAAVLVHLHRHHFQFLPHTTKKFCVLVGKGHNPSRHSLYCPLFHLCNTIVQIKGTFRVGHIQRHRISHEIKAALLTREREETLLFVCVLFFFWRSREM